MEQEIAFAQTLEKVKRTAREQGGYVTEAQVREAFSELSLDEEKYGLIYDYLKKSHIGIGKPLEDEGNLSGEDRNTLKLYLEELKHLKDYTQGEKEAFTISAMAGEKSAKEELIHIYLKDVVDIARLYAGQGVLLEDLIGEGNLALACGMDMLGSLESPGEAEGMLMKLVMDYMEELVQETSDSDKIGKRALDRVNKVNDKAKELSESYGRKVTVEELVVETDISEKAIRDALRISGFKIEDIEG